MKLTIHFPHDDEKCKLLMKIAHDVMMVPHMADHALPSLFDKPEDWAEHALELTLSHPSDDEGFDDWPGYRGGELVAWLHDASGGSGYHEPWFVLDGKYYNLPG